jgi:hypothetical protein
MILKASIFACVLFVCTILNVNIRSPLTAAYAAAPDYITTVSCRPPIKYSDVSRSCFGDVNSGDGIVRVFRVSLATAMYIRSHLREYMSAYADFENIFEKWQKLQEDNRIVIEGIVFSYTSQGVGDGSQNCSVYFLQDWEGPPQEDLRYDLKEACTQILTRLGTILHGRFAGLSDDNLLKLAGFLDSGVLVAETKEPWAAAIKENSWDELYSKKGDVIGGDGDYVLNPLVSDARWLAQSNIDKNIETKDGEFVGNVTAVAGSVDGRTRGFLVSLSDLFIQKTGEKDIVIPTQVASYTLKGEPVVGADGIGVALDARKKLFALIDAGTWKLFRLDESRL